MENSSCLTLWKSNNSWSDHQIRHASSTALCNFLIAALNCFSTDFSTCGRLIFEGQIEWSCFSCQCGRRFWGVSARLGSRRRIFRTQLHDRFHRAHCLMIYGCGLLRQYGFFLFVSWWNLVVCRGHFVCLCCRDRRRMIGRRRQLHGLFPAHSFCVLSPHHPRSTPK